MKYISILGLGILAASLASSVCAQPTNATDSTTNAAPGIQSRLQDLVAQVRAKAQAGQNTEADYTNELTTLDSLIASEKNAKSDQTAAATFLKANLYLEVIQDYDKGADILRQITNNYPNTHFSDSAANTLAQLSRLAAAKKIQDNLVPGSPFPDFAVTNLSGAPLSVGALKGKVVLLDFWATWCPPCLAELPNVIQTYKDYHDRGFEIIGVTLDADRATLDKFLAEHPGMSWSEYFYGQGWANPLVAKYGVGRIPFTVLIGPEGNILGKDLGGKKLVDAVAKAVAMGR
jgi:thiol-disulfide isomerase/thioredoxin